MEETITTQPSLSFMTSIYVDYEGDTEYNCPRLPVRLMTLAGVSMGICLCGLVGNGILMRFLCFQLEQNPLTPYILNLAAADFSLLLVFSLLLSALLILAAFCLPNFIPFYLDFVFIIEFLCDFFDLSSLGLLAAISVERCMAVLFPIWYRCHRPKHLSTITCGVLWVLAGLFVSSTYFGLKFAASPETGVDFAVSMVLLSIILVSDLSFLLKLRCSSRRRSPGKLYVALLLNVIFFFALGIPFSVEGVVNLPTWYELFPEMTTFLLVVLDSSINPVIYLLVGSCRQRRFQCSVTGAFQRLFEEKATSQERNPKPGDTVVESTV